MIDPVPTLVLWTFTEADPDLIMDQDADDTAEEILSQCYSAWRTPGAARAACEAVIMATYGEDSDVVTRDKFPWREEDALAGLKQWSMKFEGVHYLVHPVRVLD